MSLGPGDDEVDELPPEKGDQNDGFSIRMYYISWFQTIISEFNILPLLRMHCSHWMED